MIPLLSASFSARCGAVGLCPATRRDRSNLGILERPRMDWRHFIMRFGWSGIAAVTCCCGCSLVPRGHNDAASAKPAAAATATASLQQASAAASNAAGGTTVNPAELTAVLNEIQQLGMLDPPAQNALVEELKKTDPALWPQLVQAFRASIAYRRQAEERTRLAAGQGQFQSPAVGGQ